MEEMKKKEKVAGSPDSAGPSSDLELSRASLLRRQVVGSHSELQPFS